MKKSLFILVCLFTFQSYGQQKMNPKNQGSTETEIKEKLAQEPTRDVVRQERCPVEGYNLTLYSDKATNTGVSEKRYIDVVGVRK